MDQALYNRMRAICCSEWGMSPPAFESMVAGGWLAAEDVLEAVALRGFSSLGDLMAYLFREKAALKRTRMDKIRSLVIQMQATQDDAKRAKLAGMIDELNAASR